MIRNVTEGGRKLIPRIVLLELQIYELNPVKPLQSGTTMNPEEVSANNSIISAIRRVV